MQMERPVARLIRRLSSAFLLCMFCMSAAADARRNQIINPEQFIDAAGVWPLPANIPVCWEKTDSDYSIEKGWVESTVRTQIEAAADVRFLPKNGPWPVCADQEYGIRIQIADERPRSDVGRQFKRDENGNLIKDSWGRPIAAPTRMVLNFDFYLEVRFRRCLTDPDLGREHCIRAIALHEMLHALAFLHEHLRPDADKECKAKYPGHDEFKGFNPKFADSDYDPDSHVNYCAGLYRKPIRLSDGDIWMLKHLYDVQ